MTNIKRLKEISYQANTTLWEVDILGKKFEHDKIISISDLEQQLDYPDLNEFTVANTTITVSDPYEELSPHNENNIFTQNSHIQSGYRAPLVIKAGLRDGDDDCVVSIFSGEIIQISRNEKAATTTIQASDRTQEIRNKNITNFGITKTFSLEEKSSRTHGNYDVPPAISPISQHSITRMYAPDYRSEDQKRIDDREFILYPGVGTPIFVGPNSPYLYEQDTLETEGDLRQSNKYEVTNNSIRIERGALESKLNVTCKVPYRNKNIKTLIEQILNHTESPTDYDPDTNILTSYDAKHHGNFKGNHVNNPTDSEENEFYYNTGDGSIRVYTGTSWISSISSDQNERRQVNERLNRLKLTITHNTSYVYTLNNPNVSREDYEYPIIWRSISADSTHTIRIAFLQVSNNDRAFGIDQISIDIPPVVLKEDEAHFASRGRVGYDFEMFQDRDLAPQWHWNGFVTDIIYDASGGTEGRYYFLYTTPAYIKETMGGQNDSIREDNHVLSRLIQHDIATGKQTILYQESPSSASFYATHEFWRLARGEDTTTEYFYIMTANSNVENGRPQLSSYDPEEANRATEARVQHIIRIPRTKGAISVDTPNITSFASGDMHLKPQLAHFHKFATIADVNIGSDNSALRVGSEDRYGVLPDTRRTFYADDTNLYYAYFRRTGSGAKTFGYARLPHTATSPTATNINDPTDTSGPTIVIARNHDTRLNHLGFDGEIEEGTSQNEIFFGYIVQESERSTLKIVKKTNI